MPKKFTNEHTKVNEARARKSAAKQEEKDRVEKAKEDAYWEDDDKTAQKKQQRKDDQERKKAEQATKKAEKAKLYEEEMSAVTSSTKSVAAAKPTRAQLDAQREEERLVREKAAEAKRLEQQKITVHDDEALSENVNRLSLEDASARNVDEAIAVLGSGEAPADQHPEKRMRAAYTAFEERRLPQLKDEKPTFRLSQLKQLLKKEWQKSPENPLNEKLSRILK